MNAAHQALKAARALIEDPKHWTQYELSRDADGNPQDAYQPEAVCFCSVGAMLKVTHDMSEGSAQARIDAFNALVQACGGEAVVDFNDADGRTHAEVLAMFDKAIAATEPAQ